MAAITSRRILLGGPGQRRSSITGADVVIPVDRDVNWQIGMRIRRANVVDAVRRKASIMIDLLRIRWK